MVGVEIVQKNEPYYTPGYTGYCPQHKYICGKNYGDLSHKLLLDPAVSHAEKLILSDNTKDYEVVKPTKSDIKVVKSRNNRMDPIYRHPMVPGYAGFIPTLRDIKDIKPFEVQATQGIANFEREQLKRKTSRDCLRKTIELQKGLRNPETLQDCLLLKSKYKLPLIEIRPERVGIKTFEAIDEKYVKPKDYNTSPYFMDNLNPQKYFINGYTGYIPYRKFHFGKTRKPMSNDGLRDFTSDYLFRKRTEWASVVLTSIKQETLCNSDRKIQIYQKNKALMPSYAGHVPGAQFKIGKTYGYASKFAGELIEEHLLYLKMKEKTKCSKL